MSENHELRLGINAEAAKRGAREFRAAIEAVRKAVSGLERDGTGKFKALTEQVRKARDAANSFKVKGFDAASRQNLDAYIKQQQQALSAIGSTRKGMAGMASELRGMAGDYGKARTTIEGLNKSLLQTNTLLSRQTQLAAQARSSIRQVRSAPMGAEEGVVAPRRRTTGGGGDDADRELERRIRLQNAARRAVDDNRLAVERLTTELAKVGAGSSIRQVVTGFRDFEKTVSSSRLTTREFDNAKTALNSTLKRAGASLTTLKAASAEEAAAEKYAAEQTRRHAAATKEKAASQNRAAAASKAAAVESAKVASAQLSAAAAVRKAEQDVERLTQRLRSVGDSRGVDSVVAALMRLKSVTSGGVQSQLQLKAATDSFDRSLQGVRVGLISLEGQQRATARSASIMAKEERDAGRMARALERDIRSTSSATNAASQAFNRATGNLRGLENAFSSSFQIGSMFRTLIGTLTFGTFIRSTYMAGNALDQFRVSMEVATDTAEEAAYQIQFVTDLSRNLGINLRGAREDFAKFAVSTDIAGVSAAQTREIFESVSMSMAVLGRSAEDQRLAFLALEQMMSKGVVSSEELRRQLGERLPGAVNLMAQAIGVSTAELQKMLKAGEIVSAEALPKFAKALQENFGPGLQKATQRAGFQIGVLGTEIEMLLEKTARSGFMDALASETRDLVTVIRSPEAQRAAEALGRTLAEAATAAADAFQYLAENIDEVAKAASVVIGAVLIRQVALLGRATALQVQNNTAAVASFFALRGATDSATGASVRNTAAVSANAAAMRGHAASTAAAAAATTGWVTTMGRVGRLAGVAARGLGFIAGPLGLVISGFFALRPLVDSLGDSIDESAIRYKRAMERMQTSNLTFIKTAREAEEVTPYKALIQNAQDAVLAMRKVSELTGDSTRSASVMNLFDSAVGEAQGLSEAQNQITAMKALAAEFLRTGKSADKLEEAYAKFRESTNDRVAFEQLTQIKDQLDPLLKAVRTLEALELDSSKFINEDTNARLIELTSNVDVLKSRLDAVDPTALTGEMSQLAAVLGVVGGPASSFRDELNKHIVAYDGSAEAAARLKEFLESIPFDEMATPEAAARLERMRDSLVDNAEGTVELRAALDDAISALSQFQNEMRGVIREGGVAADELYNVADAFSAIARAQSEIKGLSGNFLGELKEDARIAGLEGFERFREEQLRSSQDIQKIKEEIDKARAAMAEAPPDIRAEMGYRDSVAALEAQLETATTAAEKYLRVLYDDKESNKGGGGKKGIDAQINKIRKLADEALGTEIALARLKDAESLLSSEIARKVIPSADARKQALRGMQAETYTTIAAESEYLATAVRLEEMFGKTGREIDALARRRAVEAELTRAEARATDELTKSLIRQARANLDVSQAAAEQAIGVEVKQDAVDAVKDYITATEREFEAQQMVNAGLAANVEIAGMAIDLKRADIAVTDELIGKLNELANTANNPAQAWLDSVPTWQEAAGMIERDFFQSLSDEIANFAMTGEFNIESITKTILASAAKIAADKAVKEIFGDTASSSGGGILGALLGGGGESGGAGSAIGSLIGGLFGGGDAASAGIGAAASGAVGDGLRGAAASSASSGFGSVISSVLGSLFMREGGITGGAQPGYLRASAAPAAFHNAPQYAEGTPNTSGIPAILHDNEAVIPLSRGRKVPVEMAEGGGGNVQVTNNFNFPNADADSFRRSRGQIEAEMAASSQKSMRKNR